MVDALSAADEKLFVLINQGLANRVFDWLMPPLTDWNKHWEGIAVFLALWLALMLLGGKKGRIIGMLIIPLILMSDQLSSSVLKEWIQRPRPCHEFDGLTIVRQVRLLVPCGSGYSFPSSHAVNNVAFAAFLSYYYRRWSWLFFFYAFLMGLSRIVVGVHYPSDVIAGALFGFLCAAAFIAGWESIAKTFPALAITGEPHPVPLKVPDEPSAS
jgi:membrane-associated phospholipid phosphatase